MRPTKLPSLKKNEVKREIPAQYSALLARVRRTLLEGQRRIEEERVRTYWETGRLIHAHILKNSDRAEYGAEVVRDLAGDLGVDLSLLNRCVRFAKMYPHSKIYARGPKFKWSHYRRLMTVSDDNKRLLLEKRIEQKGWTAEELAARMKTETAQEPSSSPKGTGEPPAARLIPLRGELFTYRIVERPTLAPPKAGLGIGEDSGPPPEGRGLLLDLGFGIFRNIDSRAAAQFVKGDIVQSRPKDDAYKFFKTSRSAKDLYTYRAYIEKVIDGDTLKVRFDLGFDTWMRETLRLRGLNCPELDTQEGREARAFVQSHLKDAPFVIVRSSRPDKYARYLADVFIPQGPESEPQTDLYLNNVLLEQGYARGMA
jgi:endonuclease YncB( thermonuclease family)